MARGAQAGGRNHARPDSNGRRHSFRRLMSPKGRGSLRAGEVLAAHSHQLVTLDPDDRLIGKKAAQFRIQNGPKSRLDGFYFDP